MSVQVSYEEKCARVTLTGELTIYTAAEIKAALATTMASSSDIEVDLAGASGKIKRLADHVGIDAIVLGRDRGEKLGAARSGGVADHRVVGWIDAAGAERCLAARHRRGPHWIGNRTAGARYVRRGQMRDAPFRRIEVALTPR